ncbi:hypothetical protein QQF64_000360 [Cirrhinus molitorella]|uniref:Uncharacterized protein n=1 Tax=Cirrhinus molitorella TaxID=172907 RepID=A0ABR3NXI8_9TELE
MEKNQTRWSKATKIERKRLIVHEVTNEEENTVSKLAVWVAPQLCPVEATVAEVTKACRLEVNKASPTTSDKLVQFVRQGGEVPVVPGRSLILERKEGATVSTMSLHEEREDQTAASAVSLKSNNSMRQPPALSDGTVTSDLNLGTLPRTTLLKQSCRRRLETCSQ